MLSELLTGVLVGLIELCLLEFCFFSLLLLPVLDGAFGFMVGVLFLVGFLSLDGVGGVCCSLFLLISLIFKLLVGVIGLSIGLSG